MEGYDIDIEKIIAYKIWDRVVITDTRLAIPYLVMGRVPNLTEVDNNIMVHYTIDLGLIWDQVNQISW